MSTGIEWARNRDGTAGETWNPMVGCSIPTIRIKLKLIARPGCKHCYACKDSPHRFASKYDREGVIVLRGKAKREGLTFVPQTPDGRSLGHGAQWTGEIRLLPWMLEKPLRRRKPTTYFVNSLSDVFHETAVNDERGREFIAAIFGVMVACPQHTFQLLTKRPNKAREWFEWLRTAELGVRAILCNQTAANAVAAAAKLLRPKTDDPTEGDRAWRKARKASADLWPLPNAWIGTSVENQDAADWAIPELLEIPATIRFLSLEPLLGPVVLPKEFLALGKRAWAICGGESGPGARPMHPDWARSLRDQCVAAGVPFFFKQWGEWGPSREDWTHAIYPDGEVMDNGAVWAEFSDEEITTEELACAIEDTDGETICKLGKKAAGRMLDGRTWDEFPGEKQ